MFRNILFISVLAIIAMFASPEIERLHDPGAGIAQAASSVAKTYRILFTNANLLATAFTEIESALAKDVTSISVFNTGPNPIQLALGAAGSEVVQMTIPQGTLPGNDYASSPVGAYNAVPLPVPMRIGVGRRIALRALNSKNDRGEVQINVYF